ncbi:MAG TPA: aminotransferase class IV [Fimbriiglobus sp.]|jgi:branched-subunit amino acid aminotransferase/4-amino-4-deoxychorismate lyase
MNNIPASGPDEFWWADPNLKQRLTADPLAVLKDRGVNLPAGLPAELVREVVQITSLLWVNGRVIPREQFFIDPYDDGLLFGRGVWESTRTVGGMPWLWPLHLDRLVKSAPLLDIAVAPERLPDAKQVYEFVRSLTGQDVIVRLNVTAGRPGKPGLVWMSAALRPAPLPSIRLKTLPSPVPKNQPYLLWKTFQYATRLLVTQQAMKAGYDSTLLVDPEGNVLEAAHANVFVRLEDGWATPPFDGGLLPGTVRQHLLTHSPIPIREQTVSQAQLAGAAEIFVTNSNVGICPATQIDDRTYPVGPETQALIGFVPPVSARGTPAV